jgi:hypothetical protein
MALIVYRLTLFSYTSHGEEYAYVTRRLVVTGNSTRSGDDNPQGRPIPKN